LRGGGRVQGLRDGQNEFQDEERCTCPLGLGGQAPVIYMYNQFLGSTSSIFHVLLYILPLSPLLVLPFLPSLLCCRVQNQVTSVMGIMKDNLSKVLDRGGEARGPGGEVR